MPTLPQPTPSDPLRLPEKLGASPVKVGMDSDGIGIGPEVFEALVRHFGTVKELAYELKADASQVRAEIKCADFRRLEKNLKADAKAVVADAVNRAYGTLHSADDDAEQVVAQLFALTQRLAQYVAFRRTA